jgi:hypothetical protein
MGERGLPDIYYEQYVLGELDENQRARVEQAEDFEKRIEEIHRSNDQILRQYPARQMATRIRNAYEAEHASERAAANRSTRSRQRSPLLGGRVVSFALSAALLVVAATTVIVVGDFAPNESDAIRTKGMEATMRIYRNAGDDVEVLASGAEVSQGDTLQLSYNVVGESYGAIFSIDGRGTFTLHYPESPEAALKLEASGEVILPYAYELDDAPEFEKFYFITSEEPFELDRIFDSVAEQIDVQQANPDYEMQFDAGIEVRSSILRKTE